MKVINKVSGEEYKAIVFDGENFVTEVLTYWSPAFVSEVLYYDSGSLGPNVAHIRYTAELDSPSGEKVSQPIKIGTYILTSETGSVTACHADTIARDYRVETYESAWKWARGE
jgi:hypothetical protein